MSDFSSSLKNKKLSPARVLTREEAPSFNYRSGTQNPTKYFDITNSRVVDLVPGYLILSPVVKAYNYGRIGEMIFQYEVSLPSNFYIFNLEFINVTIGCMRGGALFVKYRVGTTVYRYLLKGLQQITGASGILYTRTQNTYAAYNNQVIGRNCVFEFGYRNSSGS